MKRIFIVHGWGGSPNEPIHKWLKKELAKNKFTVVVPKMPNTDNPTIKEWVSYLSEQVGTCDDETFFFGHSIGCQTIMRYLATLSDTQKAGGAVFLSGWFNLDNMETDEEKTIAQQWIETPIDFKKIRKVCKKIEVIISDDEPYGYVKENTEKFKKELDAHVTIEHGKGHYTADDGVTQISTALATISKLMST